MTPSKTLFFFCVAFVVGIGLESLVKIPTILLWGFLVAATVLIVAGFFKKKELAVAGFCLLALVLGASRLQIAELAMGSDVLFALQGSPEKITLTGIVAAEPDVRGATQRLKIKIGRSLVLVTTGRYPEYRYLDTVTVAGALKEPPALQDFDYKSYLAKDGIYSVMDFPEIEPLSRAREYTIFSFAYEKILWLKNGLVKSLHDMFSPPGSAILEGIIFGNDKTMDKELKNRFNATGLSHVTAVSGSNIVILISVLMAFLLALGFWRGQAFYAAVLLIWLYVAMIGLPVSGVRAAIMGCVALLAGKLGRQNAGSRVLTMTAGAMLLQNPMLLAHDIGFQLSFLASLGIIQIKPLIDYYLVFLPKEQFKYWLDIISVTLAAQVITLPVIVYHFNQISLVSLVTNILVLPIIPLLTIAGFLASVAGVLWGPLGLLFSLPCLAMLWYFTAVLDFFSGSFAVAPVGNISWVWVAVYYLALAALVVWLRALQRPKFLG